MSFFLSILPSLVLSLCYSCSCKFHHLWLLTFIYLFVVFVSADPLLFTLNPFIPLLWITTLTLSGFLCPSQAVNQAGAGPYSEQVSFRTPATNPDPVSSLNLLDLPVSSESGHSPSTCLFLKWEEPNSNGAEITCYVITLDDQTITVESGTSHLVSGLQPDSEYRYRHKLVSSRADVSNICNWCFLGYKVRFILMIPKSLGWHFDLPLCHSVCKR